MDSEFSRKKLLVLGVLLLVFLAIPITVYTALQHQSSNSRADVSDDSVVAMVNGQQVTKAQVRAVAEEQYDPADVDQPALQDALEILIERKILDNAANTFSLVPEPARVDRFKQEGFSDTDAKYEALKQQVTLKAVNSREVLSIGFWNPPSAGISTLSIQEQSTASNELLSGIPALNTAETRMRAGDDVQEIGDSILAQYPNLAPVLEVNGIIYAPLNDEEKSLSSYPQIYEFGDLSLDNETRDAVFAQNQGGIVKTTDSEANRGGTVIKVETKGNVNGANTYEEWLAQQKTSLVQNVGSL